MTRCAGNNHFELPVTIGGVTVTMNLTPDDMAVDFASREEAKEALVARIRSAVKEANASTFAQVRSALDGMTFKL